MQIILNDEDGGNSNGRIDLVDFVICIERISGCIEGKYLEELRKRTIRI